jgi:hypothetical protein
MTHTVFTIKEAVAESKTSRTALYSAIGRGELVARKRGKRTLILADELHRWLEGLPVFKPFSAGGAR